MTVGVQDPEKKMAMPLVLVIDDDEDIQELITNILQSASFQVMSTLDGGNALAKIQQQKPDLILLDVMLSDISGLELLKQIRNSNDPEVRQIPIILLSAMAERPKFESNPALGQTQFLTKPFQARVLVEQVSAMIRTSNQISKIDVENAGPQQGLNSELPEIEILLNQRRAGVLLRAIAALESASVDQLQAVTHKIAGTLSLYSFVEEGSQARTLSEWLRNEPNRERTAMLKRRDALLELLKNAIE